MNKIERHNFVIKGDAFEIFPDDDCYPESFRQIPDPPEKLYLIGNPNCLREGLAIVGARKATPYGVSCTRHFAEIAAKQNIAIISGGAYGCDGQAHKAAIALKKKTVVFLGGGCNKIYPPRHYKMFQDVVDLGGALVSEKDWNYEPLRHTFLQRNRLIAALAKATLIVEAGLPSGTFSTADYALKYNKDVLAVPGAITNPGSAGCNTLIYQGAIPIINDEVFYEYLFKTFNCLKPYEGHKVIKQFESHKHKPGNTNNPILEALMSQCMSIDELYLIAKNKCKNKNPSVWLSEKLVLAEQTGLVAKYSNGLYGPVVKN